MTLIAMTKICLKNACQKINESRNCHYGEHKVLILMGHNKSRKELRRQMASIHLLETRKLFIEIL